MGFRVEERTGRWWVVNSTDGHDGGLSSTSFYSSSVVMVWELEWGNWKGRRAGGRAELGGSQGVFVSLKWRNFDRYFGYKQQSLCTECQQPAGDKLLDHRFSTNYGRDGNWWAAAYKMQFTSNLFCKAQIDTQRA